VKRIFLFILTMAVTTAVVAKQAAAPGQPPQTVPSKTDSIKNVVPEKTTPPADTMKVKADTIKTAKSTKSAKKGAAAMSPDKGIGPITSVTLGPIDTSLADKGKSTFTSICTACHALDKKMVGPPLREITEQRTPEFIMNMLMNTPEMQNKDPEVKKLIAEYKVLMTIPKLNQDQARALLEYLRQADQDKPKKK
jgi:mono/diheme cytochrome c family protein